MASVDTDAVESLNCCICDHECTGPRKLPECGHQCCETCILIHITKLKDDGELENGFSCPSCEVINPGPKDLKAAIHWIQSLERGVVTDTKTKAVKGETKVVECNPCKAVHKSTKAVKRCEDCNEAFCASCSVCRHTHPLLKEHKLTGIDSSSERSEEAGDLFQMLCDFVECDNHAGSPVTFYCNDDEEYACETCVDIKHRDCNDVVKANTVAMKEGIEEDAKIMENSAENICDYAKTLIEEKATHLEAIDKQVKVITAKLKAIRDNINRLLDSFEGNVTKSAQSAAKKRKTTIYRDINILEDMAKTSKLYIELIEKLNTAGSPCQTDIVARMMKKGIKSYEETLLKMSKTFKTEIGLKQETTLLQLPNVVNDHIHGQSTLEEKEVDSKNPTFQSRLLLSHCKIVKVKDISIEGKYRNQPNYTGVVFLRNDNIILVDENNKTCSLVKQTGDVSDPLVLSTKITSLTSIDTANKLFREASKKDKLVVIPSPAENKIVLLSTDEKLEVKYAVDTVYQPKALHVMRNGDIAVAWYNPVAFGIISVGEILVQTKVYFRKDKAGREMKTFSSIAVDEQRSHVIQPCTNDDAVYCFDFEGNHKFKCGDISTPRGVVLDADSNIYVFAHGSHSLHVISPTGLQFRKFRFVSYPLAVAFNKDGDEFAVTQQHYNHDHTVSIFKLKKHADAEKE